MQEGLNYSILKCISQMDLHFSAWKQIIRFVLVYLRSPFVFERIMAESLLSNLEFRKGEMFLLLDPYRHLLGDEVAPIIYVDSSLRVEVVHKY